MAISVSGGASTTAGSGSTHDFSLTVADADDYLVVGVCVGDNGDVVNSVVIDPGGANEATLTRADAQANGTSAFAALYYLLDTNIPPSGTYTVRVNLSVSDQGVHYARALQGAAQQAPEATSGGSGSGDPSVDITTLTDGALVFDAVATRDAESFTVGVDQTVEVNSDDDASDMHGAGSRESVPTAGTITMSWDSSTAAVWAGVAAAIAPAATGTTTTKSATDTTRFTDSASLSAEANIKASLSRFTDSATFSIVSDSGGDGGMIQRFMSLILGPGKVSDSDTLGDMLN